MATRLSTTERFDDHGQTLVETLITIVLLGVVVVAIMSAVQVGVRASTATFELSSTETALLNAVDRIQRAPQRCEYDDYVAAASRGAGWSSDAIVVTKVERLLTIRTDAGITREWRPQPCPAGVYPFDVQRITVQATNPVTNAVSSIEVVKSAIDVVDAK